MYTTPSNLPTRPLSLLDKVSQAIQNNLQQLCVIQLEVFHHTNYKEWWLAILQYGYIIFDADWISNSNVATLPYLNGKMTKLTLVVIVINHTHIRDDIRDGLLVYLSTQDLQQFSNKFESYVNIAANGITLVFGRKARQFS